MKRLRVQQHDDDGVIVLHVGSMGWTLFAFCGGAALAEAAFAGHVSPMTWLGMATGLLGIVWYWLVSR